VWGGGGAVTEWGCVGMGEASGIEYRAHVAHTGKTMTSIHMHHGSSDRQAAI
jgi:hypothetical protein